MHECKEDGIYTTCVCVTDSLLDSVSILIEYVYNIIHGMYAGTDEKAIVNVLAYRSNAQRIEIKLKFKSMYGKVCSDNLYYTHACTICMYYTKCVSCHELL